MKKVYLASLGYSESPTPNGEPGPKEFSLRPPSPPAEDSDEGDQTDEDAEVVRATGHNPNPAAKPGKTVLVRTPSDPNKPKKIVQFK